MSDYRKRLESALCRVGYTCIAGRAEQIDREIGHSAVCEALEELLSASATDEHFWGILPHLATAIAKAREALRVARGEKPDAPHCRRCGGTKSVCRAGEDIPCPDCAAVARGEKENPGGGTVVIGPKTIAALIRRYNGIGADLTVGEMEILMFALHSESESRGGIAAEAMRGLVVKNNKPSFGEAVDKHSLTTEFGKEGKNAE